MQMYKVLGDVLTTAEISRTSDDSVWEVGLNGSEVRKLRVPKSDKHPAYFEDLATAKIHLIEKAKAGVAIAQSRLERASDRLQQIVEM